MLTNAILPITFGAFGMIAALLIYVNILKTPSGEGRVKEIADEIHLGAMVFMASEYKRLAIFCLICIIALYASLGADTAYLLHARRALFWCSWLHWYVFSNQGKC
jgi:K(+)-stimulated pyrophosphate-energized sodium pump